MKKKIKYLMVGVGMFMKLWGVPQEVNCPTLENKLEINYLEKDSYYHNTTNVKKVEEFYDLCRGNSF